MSAKEVKFGVEARDKMVSAETVAHFHNLFRQRERAWLQQAAYDEERDFMLEYEEFRQQLEQLRKLAHLTIERG